MNKFQLKIIIIMALFFILVLCRAHKSVLAQGASEESETTYTVAVIPFEASGEELKYLGPQVTLLINTYLSVNNKLSLVERAELDKALSELELGISGLISPDKAAQIGQLTGAKILITGRIFPVQNELFLVAKMIGTETSQIFAEAVSISLKESHADASKALANKIASTITEKGDVLIAKKKIQSTIDDLKLLMEGKETLPTISINIDERHVGESTLDPAAETEIALMLQTLGFKLLDNSAKDQPDIEITGEAISEFGLRQGNLVSCKARVEVKAIELVTGEVIAVDRESEVAIDISEQIAGKAAIEKASKKIAERIIPRLVKYLEK
jgi:hypothetical protein